ncbi:MAG TPA: ATPase, T2SS/T4P/T4SS family [Anaerohalosphaeraceae bacterium]|nr:Flp pilus assembly complex ATPase component TadA [Phycisphaerae bacterium]HOK95839.1 ATPase, T2SS/T4P/T4SS family [Anaerohalosphaeraceae bacterium]HOL30434.1 ATPase, T2SS/T4P/T4SS family [Anaerohalosphaeraceae bacterium]HOM75821.1 ATPase, T2SS/T4P/T4SS family [Anaerohalosphaeraceae bacterium]HPC64097.1 ATPase, T2SS/T4P/T4SS family [Anaerohalosphaeraceae bacterium]
MPMDVIASVDYGGYVSLWKLLFFMLAFVLWAPMVNWVFTDSQAVRTNTLVWTLTIALAGIGALFVWLLIPVFIIGLLLYLLVFAGASMAYVIHRNSRVAEFEKVLTSEHIRGLLVNPAKKMEKASRGITFITANGNEVPLPEPKSREAEGFILACEVIDDAVYHRADVVRFVPQKEDYALLYEIDGVTTQQNPRTREDIDHFVYYVKELAGLEVEEKRKPQKGRFTAVLPDNKRTSWEVSTSGSTAGEQIRLERISELVSRKIADLGLNDNQFESINSLRDIKSGLVIISGPPKSGVTTTFYTLLGNHDPFMNNINTLEKNPAAELPNITQVQFTLGDSGENTYARRLQSVLRRGPDIIGVADCEDDQTAKLCTAAAKDGKIVYVCISATSVSDAMDKWCGWVGDKGLIADTLEAVINQRLVRRLCMECRQAYQPNPALFKKFNLPPDDARMFYRPGEIEYDKHGKPIVCKNCQGTGFFGRVGLFETIRITPELRDAIRKAKTVQEITTAFRRAGMLYMQEQSIKKVSESITSINEVIRNFSAKS